MTATSPPPPSQPPAGWYADPNNPGGQRYWDGQVWTEHSQPAPPPMASGPRLGVNGKEQDATGLIVTGYVFAVIIPIVGFVIGLTQINKNRHGVWVVLLSVAVFVIVLIVIISAANSGHTCTNAFGQSYSC